MIEFKTKEMFFSGRENIHTFYSRSKADSWKWELHGHEFFELELFISGKGYQILNGERFEISKGSIHLLTTSDFHEMVWEKDVNQIVIRFDRTSIDKKLTEKIFSAGHAIFCNLNDEEFKTILKMMQLVCEYESNEPSVIRNMFMKNMLESVIIMLLKKVVMIDEKKESGRNHVQRAIAYLEMNFKDDPGLDEVAAYVGLNKNYFSSLFKQETGKSFVRYSVDLKLEYSKNLICSSTMTMNEICFSSGFNSFSNFAREFRKKYNITPLQYRKKRL